MSNCFLQLSVKLLYNLCFTLLYKYKLTFYRKPNIYAIIFYSILYIFAYQYFTPINFFIQ